MAAGDITYSNPADDHGHFCSGKFETDGAATAGTHIVCGFTPTMIVLYYKDGSPSSDEIRVVWFAGMTDGEYFGTTFESGAQVLNTGSSIAPSTSEDGDGFTTDYQLDTTASLTCYWMAFR